ncbi:hypothetical protein [Streptomyces sp. GbtcB6]|uniref:hypothetical protein n=1 Tax=Streptomyces sp. GbtcB6 TaxID=2824751 RepID=UPI001C30BE6B|nr:hypothetical protein [Streptomyces sp. GbtcB6]
MQLRRVLAAAVVGTTALATTIASTDAALAARPPLTSTSFVAHLDLAAGQQPENLTLLPRGAAAVTFAFSRQVAVIERTGVVRVLATLPAPPVDARTPVLGSPFLGVIVQGRDHALYFLYATGTDDLTGVWRLPPGGSPERIAALPADALPNGLALDRSTGQLYAADSVLGRIWRIPATGGTPEVWATGSALSPAGFLGANGVKVHDGAVWVSNLDDGTLLRIPVRRDGTPGAIRTAATDLTGIDDFAFTGRGDRLLAALNAGSEVALVSGNGGRTVVLDHTDGLQNPTSVAVRGNKVYVADAAYVTQQDPNLLTTRLHCPSSR